MYEDKYKLSKEQSLFLAKKKWDENVYCGMKMENRAVTFPQVKTILDGVNVSDVKLDDIQAILNMRDAWKFILNTIWEPLTIEYMCKLNEYIARNETLAWGVFRTGSVSISGTDYTPPVPDRMVVENQFNDIINANKTVTEKALDLFLWGARGQFFWDGNKRTSMSIANKVLLSHGVGLLNITDSNMGVFNSLLVNYYNTGDTTEIKRFLYDKAIQGIIF